MNKWWPFYHLNITSWELRGPMRINLSTFILVGPSRACRSIRPIALRAGIRIPRSIRLIFWILLLLFYIILLRLWVIVKSLAAISKGSVKSLNADPSAFIANYHNANWEGDDNIQYQKCNSFQEVPRRGQRCLLFGISLERLLWKPKNKKEHEDRKEESTANHAVRVVADISHQAEEYTNNCCGKHPNSSLSHAVLCVQTIVSLVWSVLGKSNGRQIQNQDKFCWLHF